MRGRSPAQGTIGKRHHAVGGAHLQHQGEDRPAVGISGSSQRQVSGAPTHPAMLAGSY
jgi:hypothetical protein